MVLQKDETKQWGYTGFACKVSIEKSIITNAENRKTMLSGLETLGTLYHLSPEQTMNRFCKKLAETIEEKGVHLGDVAFDIIIDSELNLWGLETQIRYRAFMKKDVQSDLFYKSMDHSIMQKRQLQKAPTSLGGKCGEIQFTLSPMNAVLFPYSVGVQTPAERGEERRLRLPRSVATPA